MTRSPNAQRIVPVMPPLTDEEIAFGTRERTETTFCGRSCENIVASYLLNHGKNVAVPTVDIGVDYLVQESKDRWEKAQVKKIVFQMHKDYGMFDRSGTVVKRPRFCFNFQSSGGEKAKQHGPETIDVFYHVLQTNLRTLVFKIDSSLIPLRKDGTFIMGKYPVLERDSWARKLPDFDIRKMLIFAQYDHKLFREYPDFFLKEEPITVDQFF